MGLISGSVSCTRFNVVTLPDNPQFDLIPFRPITPGSSIREKEGFLPYEPDAAYELGSRRWAFRVRIDRVALDATLIRERVMELVKIETETVGPPGPKARQRLKMEAEEEMMAPYLRSLRMEATRRLTSQQARSGAMNPPCLESVTTWFTPPGRQVKKMRQPNCGTCP